MFPPRKRQTGSRLSLGAPVRCPHCCLLVRPDSHCSLGEVWVLTDVLFFGNNGFVGLLLVLFSVISAGSQQHKTPFMSRPVWSFSGVSWEIQLTKPSMATCCRTNGGTARVRYLHDGRVRSIFEAILWHNGDAQPARLKLEALLPDQRDDVLMTLSSL